MKIKITNKQEMQKALDTVQAHCKERLATVESIVLWANLVESRLEDAGIPKKLRNGMVVDFGYRGYPAHSYKYAYIGTVGKIERGARDWYLTSIRRAECASTHGNRLTVPNDTVAEVECRLLKKLCTL